MHRPISAGAIVGLAFAAAGFASMAQTPATSPPVGAAPPPKLSTDTPAPAPRPPGYLLPGDLPDTFAILPAAPRAGSAAKAEDIAAFRETRKLIGTPRWELARTDAVEANIIDDMACALGVRLTQETAPHLFRMLARLGRDASRMTNLPKDQYKQVRPFLYLGDKDAICTEEQRKGLGKTFSYPSGHTTWGWTVGLILAEAAPDRAQAILARSRAFGESRVVCGVHWASDVSEGRVNAAVMLAVLHAKPEFAADLAEAKLEIAAARKAQGTTPLADPGRCAVEAEASAHTPWAR